MDTVLVTGGTGHLGRNIVPQLQQRNYRVRILARTPGQHPAIDWIQGDLATGEGIAEAVADAHTIVHAATLSPAARRGRFRLGDFFRSPPDVDVQGTRRLLAQAKQAGAEHFLRVHRGGAGLADSLLAGEGRRRRPRPPGRAVLVDRARHGVLLAAGPPTGQPG
jgi:uncharacterized protein YbjT (DUF2867 family)